MNIIEIENALLNEKYGSLSPNLFRVQKMSKKSNGSLDIYFRHHLETSVDDKKIGGEQLARDLDKVIIIKSLNSLLDKNPVKVKITATGKVYLV